MDNREVTLPNPATLKTDKEPVSLTTEKIIKVADQDDLRSDEKIINSVEETEVKLPSDESIVKMEPETIITNDDNPKELMMNAKKIFVEKFENASVEEKQAAVTQFYNAIDNAYKVTYRGKSVPIVFSKDEGYAFNHDGFIRIPLNILEKQSPEKAAYSILHEYRHAMQPSLNVYSSGMGLGDFNKLSHDMRVEEVDAAKFAFENMDSLGLDKTKIDRYNDWQMAISLTDTFNLLKLNYNQETAENVLGIYKLLDEYTLQTTRSDKMSDDIRGKFNKIRAKIEFRSNKKDAKAKLAELEKIAKLNNDRFLLNVVSEVRKDWPQFHL